MTMLQHYYTSCEKGMSGSAGFQIKAMSPGISSEEMKILNNIIGYRIPPSMDEYDTARHPIALRYQYLGSDKCILVCSQSNGSDENGRPGNFFAHSVITSPQDFAVISPIMYWRHEFWLTNDLANRMEIPPEPAFDLAPSLEFEQIWPFLDEGGRRDWFYKLLCAVINYDQKKRPIVILDKTDHIALWIAAVTFALPSIYRPFLTFATYHHDPYQVPFHITGTTNDSKFRCSSDEYISYFILNAEINRISDIEGSIYADFICQNFHPQLFEEKLLGFFDVCNNRLYPPRLSNLAAKLESVVNFYLTIRERSLSPKDPNAQQSLKNFLNYIETKSELLPDDLDDLISVTDKIVEVLRFLPSSASVNDYGRAIRLLKKHEPNFTHRCKKDLRLLVGFVLQGDETLPEQLFAIYKEVYPEQLLVQAASQAEFVAVLEAEAPRDNLKIHYLIWTHLIPLIRFDAQNSPKLGLLMQKALLAVDNFPFSDPTFPSSEAEKLLTTIAKATNKNQKFLLGNLITWKQKSSGYAFAWLYYILVKNLSLDDRKPYRNQLKSVAPDIMFYEVERDVRSASGVENLIFRLESWIKHTAEEPALQSKVVSHGLKKFWYSFQQLERNTLAENILSSELISTHLDQSWGQELLSSYFAGLMLKPLNPQTAQLYERYVNYPNLNIEQRALIGGSLALTTDRFPEKVVPEIQRWLSQLDQNTYRQEVVKFIAHFFAKGLELDEHIQMLQATYVQHHEAIFWEEYWIQFKDLLLDQNRAHEFVDMLAFWFDASLSVFRERPYLGPAFFLQLPDVLTEARDDKAFKRAIQQINHQAMKHNWYPLVKDYFTSEKKRTFLSLLRK